MKRFFEIKNGVVVNTSDETAPVCVIDTPDNQEKRHILDVLKIDGYDLDSALDPDEISRVEFEVERISVIWKLPKQVAADLQLRFDVSSVGIFLNGPGLTMICGEDLVQFSPKDFHGVVSPTDLLLRFLFATTRHFMGHLKVIKQITMELESKISASMENRYLLQMFALSESLTYYLTAIEGNQTVLLKLSSKSAALGFSKTQIDFLDDIVLESKQCARQAQIYSTVLSGLMDARGTIINNNMNVLLKNLTMINVVFLPLNLIASIGGMSEFSMMTQGVGWKASYFLFSLAMLLIGWLTWFALSRYLHRNAETRIKRQADYSHR